MKHSLSKSQLLRVMLGESVELTIEAMNWLHELNTLRESVLDALAAAANQLSHAVDCPYRHHGECLCIRSQLLNILEKNGRD